MSFGALFLTMAGIGGVFALAALFSLAKHLEFHRDLERLKEEATDLRLRQKRRAREDAIQVVDAIDELPPHPVPLAAAADDDSLREAA